MVRLALEEHGNASFQVIDWECTQPRPSYTIDTLKYLVSKKITEPVLIIGNEVFKNFSQWKKPKEILNLARVAVIQRVNYDKNAIENILKELNLSEKVKKKIEPLEIETVNISSTQVREALSSNDNSVHAFLPKGVCTYIKRFGLYSDK
jgi:nicotinate-nucleotide adenylyltransferase